MGGFKNEVVVVNDSGTAINPATEGTLAKLAGMSIGEWDKVTQTQVTLTDTWAFELNSAAINTVVITYTDATKAVISTVVLS